MNGVWAAFPASEAHDCGADAVPAAGKTGGGLSSLSTLQGFYGTSVPEWPILPGCPSAATEFDTALKNINDAVKEADDKMYTAKKRARETADPLRKN